MQIDFDFPFGVSTSRLAMACAGFSSVEAYFLSFSLDPFPSVIDCFLSGDWSAFDEHADQVHRVIFGERI